MYLTTRIGPAGYRYEDYFVAVEVGEVDGFFVIVAVGAGGGGDRLAKSCDGVG